MLQFVNLNGNTNDPFKWSVVFMYMTLQKEDMNAVQN
jgi:hypothetical protein